MAIEIRPLRKTDRREDFRCGDPDLDIFFQRFAGQNQFRYHIGVTYVAADDATIYGYMTVASGSIEVDELAGSVKLPTGYPLPILRVGRLAVDHRYQGRGLGKQLLLQALLLALQQRDLAGCVGVVVDAKRNAAPFYQNFGFRILRDVLEGEVQVHPSPLLMFLPIRSIASAS